MDDMAERRAAYQRKVDQQPSIQEIREALADGEMMARQDPGRYYAIGARITDVLSRIPELARLGDVDDLDAAWAEAEAATPPGINRGIVLSGPVGLGYVAESAGGAFVTGPTPAAALRALAAKLRGE